MTTGKKASAEAYRQRMTRLTARTRKRIFGILAEKGLKDMRHEIQMGVIGKASLTQFTEGDGQDLIRHLLGASRGGKGEKGKRGKGEEKKKSARKKYTRADGVIAMYPVLGDTQRSIRFAYALMHELIKDESQAHRRGLLEKDENYSDKPGPRLDGWARKISNGEARGISQLMQEEISRMLTQLRNRRDWLRKKIIKSQKEGTTDYTDYTDKD